MFLAIVFFFFVVCLGIICFGLLFFPLFGFGKSKKGISDVLRRFCHLDLSKQVQYHQVPIRLWPL